MFYIFQDGRILCDSELLTEDDVGKFIQLEALPIIETVDGKTGIITGCNLETGKLLIDYVDTPLPDPLPEQLPKQTKSEPTETERIMQGFTDSELRDLEIQQNQELLAQQMTDIEVALLGGDK